MSTDLYMIRPDGGLNLASNQVTWFSFLQCSRAMNSTQGGWNFKAHWRKKGLHILAKQDSEIAALWLRNSLKNNCLLKPRSKDFKLKRQLSEEREQLKHAWDSSEHDTNKCREDELNVGLYFQPPDGVRWLSYEVPLCRERAGQLEIDLVGYSNSPNPSLEIFELKAGNGTDSPLMALVEAICYAIQIHRCRTALLTEMKASPEGSVGVTEKHFQRIKITLAAPNKYWTYYWEVTDDDRQKMAEIVEKLNQALEVEDKQTRFSLATATIDQSKLKVDYPISSR